MDPLPSDHEYFGPVRSLLRAWSLQQWLQQRPPSAVHSLTASATCACALRMLATHNISSAPVFDGKTYIGFICCLDILRALLGIVNVRELTEENKEYRLRAAGLQLEHQQLRSLNPAQDGALIYRADMQSTLHDVVLYGFLQPNAAGYTHVVHRVGVFDAADEDMSDEEDPAGAGVPGLRGISISHVISQSDVLMFLHKHVEELGPLADATLQQLGLASKPVVCVPAEMSTIKAFATMVANKVSCVGVVAHGQGGGLAASLSSSDLCGLLPEQFASALSTPVLQYLTAKASPAWASQQHARLVTQQQQQQQQKPHPPQQQFQQLPVQQQQEQTELMQQQPQQPQPQQPQPQQPQQQQPLAQVQAQAPPCQLQPQPQQLAAHPCAPPPAGSAQTWGLKSGEGLRPPELQTVGPASTLREVLALLAGRRLHRLHVTDARQRPVGIVTITDLLRVIVGCNELLEALGPDLEELEQEVDQMRCEGLDCDCGMDSGSELIEGRRGIVPVSSQALLST